MSEKLQEQVSAFTDDELSEEECAFLVRRLERDPEFRDRALRYSMIGAAMRGELLNPDPDLLRRRVREELDGIRSTGHERAPPVASRRLIRPAAGFGIAAAVALTALLVLGIVNRPVDPGDPSQLIADTGGDAVPEGPVSYIVPDEPVDTLVSGNPMSASPIRLTNYLITHGEYASGLGRTSIHTDVLRNSGPRVLVTTSPRTGTVSE